MAEQEIRRFRWVKALLAGVAVAAAVSACGEPGHVVSKTVEGPSVTGKHYVHCRYGSGRVSKQRATYSEFVKIRIGDPC